MNWGEIKAAVRRYLENDEVTFVANLTLFARMAEEQIYRQVQLQWTKQLATTQLPAGDRYLSIPGEGLAVYSLSFTDPVTGEYMMVLPKDFGFLKEAYPNPAAVGVPRFYAYRDEQVLLIAPTPDQIYDVEMHYYRKPSTIGANDNDGNTNWLSTYGENALIFGIIVQGYIYEKGDQDVIAKYTEQFTLAVSDLKLIAEGRQAKDTYRQLDQRMPV